MPLAHCFANCFNLQRLKKFLHLPDHGESHIKADYEYYLRIEHDAAAAATAAAAAATTAAAAAGTTPTAAATAAALEDMFDGQSADVAGHGGGTSQEKGNKKNLPSMSRDMVELLHSKFTELRGQQEQQQQQQQQQQNTGAGGQRLEGTQQNKDFSWAANPKLQFIVALLDQACVNAEEKVVIFSEVGCVEWRAGGWRGEAEGESQIFRGMRAVQGLTTSAT
jgi:hypothetical protein